MKKILFLITVIAAVVYADQPGAGFRIDGPVVPGNLVKLSSQRVGSDSGISVTGRTLSVNSLVSSTTATIGGADAGLYAGVYSFSHIDDSVFATNVYFYTNANSKMLWNKSGVNYLGTGSGLFVEYWDSGGWEDFNSGDPVDITMTGTPSYSVIPASIKKDGVEVVTVNGGGITNPSAFKSTINADTPSAFSFAIMGDSLTAVNGQGILTGGIIESKGYFNRARAMFNSRCTLVTNSSSSGKTTDIIIISNLPVVRASSANIVIVCAGANNASFTNNPAAAVADLRYIATNLTSAGKKVVFMTVPPVANFNATNNFIRSYINSKLAEFPILYPNVYVCDITSPMLNQRTGASIYGYNRGDGIHWTELGAQTVATRLAEVVNKLNPTVYREWHGFNSPLNICGNPDFASNAVGWTAGTTNESLSVVASTNYDGNSLIISITNNYGTTYSAAQYVENISGGRFTTNDVIRLSADIEYGITENSTNGTFRPYFAIAPRLNAGAGGGFETTIYGLFAASTETNYVPVIPPVARGVYEMQYMVNTNVDRLYIAVGFQSMKSGYVKVHRFQAYKVQP